VVVDCSDFLNVIVTGSKNRSIQVWTQDNVESPSGHFDGHEAAINKVLCYRDSEFTVLIRWAIVGGGGKGS
jgi:hypothetical protein